MARPLRILFANAWYHVMNRGRSHATIFYDNSDINFFLKLLLQIHKRYRFEIHAYCLMPNHYHLLLRTPLPNLSQSMRHLNSAYTQYFNKKYINDGALFRGRYRAILVDAENYLLQLSKYIHLNPVKAGLVKHPKNYYWSSYRYYSTKIAAPDWLYTKQILNHFGNKQQKNKYSLFVLENSGNELENFYRKARLLPILGTDIFCKIIKDVYLTKQNISKEIPDQKNICITPDLQKICNVVASYYQVSVESLYTTNRIKGNLPRTIAIYLAANASDKTYNIISNHFKNVSYSGVSQIVRRINKTLSSNQALLKNIKSISNLI